MAVMSRLLPLFAYSTFALFIVVLMATPTNALAHEGRVHAARGHDSIAKRKRNPVKRAKRCRPQTTSLAAANTSPSTSAPPASSTPAATTHAAAATTTKAATTQPASSKPATTKAATSSTHSSSSAAPVSTSVSSGGSSTGSGKKLLLAWADGPTNLDKVQYGTNVAGMYNWSPWKPGNCKVPFFPMLWGSKQKSDFTSQVINAKTTTPELIFGFNEPNQSGQSDMSAADGAALWNQMILPFKAKGAKLVSPATTNAPSGKTWIQDMNKACGGDCQFDYMAIHWYGTNPDDLKAYVTDWCNTFGKPVIVSEYACQNFSGGAQCTKDETDAFHYTMWTWFKQNSCVHLVAPFGFLSSMSNVNTDNQLIGSDGTPNALGSNYLYN